jgi:PIN domain nuclease of toxin-antitoxin system
MANLLDTHTLIWFIEGDKLLTDKAISAIYGAADSNFVSIASIWEIAIKLNIEKLKLQTSFLGIQKKMDENGFKLLPVNFEHTLILRDLPLHHRDPFDRMIIAQSITESLTIISKDKNFSLYPIKLLW